ncbi:MAG TPA: hypothetical protein VGH76_25770, partial [Actinomycetospora sp.]|uniref:DUF7144 family membrane protein n=1 Tax=Actinomycetospora sp. TaxID=1872135 RepID=UPI002F3E75E0
MTSTGPATFSGGQSRYEESPPSYSGTDDWSGWISFAGIMMILLGSFQVIEGLVALLHSSYFVVPATGLVVNVSYNAWGWFHLILGVLIFAAGFGVMAGRLWARIVGIALALL